MRSLPHIALATSLLACASGTSMPGPVDPIGLASMPGRPDHVLLVSLSALSAEAYAPAGVMRHVSALARGGVAAEAVRSVAPASAYPVHASIVTGSRPVRHGIPADRRLGERGVRASLYSHASALSATTLWAAAAQADLSVASLGWPTTVGASIPLLLPDVEPVGRGESWLLLLEEAGTPRLVELVRDFATPEAAAPGRERDRVLTRVACSILESSPPDLLLLRLSQAGVARGRFGPRSSAFQDAVVDEDTRVGELLACLRAAGLGEKSAIILVGEPAGVPVHTAIRVNRVLEDAGLLTVGAGGVRSWAAIARSNGGSAFIYAREAEDALDARVALGRAIQATRAFRLVSAEEMIELGADPEAWFGIEAEPGFVIEDGVDGELLAPSRARGAIGYLPGDGVMLGGFVAFGRGLRTGIRVPVMDVADVAPTVALLMGLRLEGAEGRILVGTLDLAVPVGMAAP